MGSFGIIKNGKKQIITGVGGGGGHVIQNASGTDLTQRDTLQFGGYLQTTDDSTNEKTVVSDEPTEVTWSAWQQMTDIQKEGTKWLITDVPSADGTISADLLTKLWENPNPTASFAAQHIILSSDDYDILIIIFSDGVSAIAKKGETVVAQSSVVGSTTNTNINTWGRTITYVSDTELNVTTGYKQTTGSTRQQSDETIIPIIIYGIKKTVTVTFDALAKNVSTLASNCMLSDGVTSVENTVNELNAQVVKLTGTLASTTGTIVGISYPTGFTSNNCIVIGAMYETDTNTYAMNANNGTQRFDVILYPSVIAIIPRDASALSKNVKIILQKFT